MGYDILEIENLHKSYGADKVIDGVSLTISPGDALGFIGPNGAGKTTIIRMVLGLVRPDRGSIRLGGYSVKTDFFQAIAQVGAVVEVPVFYPYLSGYQNLLYTANLHKQIPKSRIDELLAVVGLETRAKDKVKTYSLGMKQRLGIARALVNDPKIVFLDEPMNGLDPQGMVEIKDLIRNLVTDQGITFFITSHLLKELEDLCNKVAVLKEGRIIAQGDVEHLLSTDHEIIEIFSAKIAAAEAAMKSLSYARVLKNSDNKLLAEVEKGMSGRLNEDLVNRGIEVRYLVPVKETLESYFIQLTREGSSHA